MVSSSWLAASCKQLLCLRATALHLGFDCGLRLGRQVAWRLGTSWMVLSSWLAALCKQLLYLKATARYWDSDCGLKLSRQAAWRPGTFGWCCQVGWRHSASNCCVLKVIARYLGSAEGSDSVVKLLGGRVHSGWCRQLVGGTVQAVAVFRSDCEVLGL